MLACYDRGRRFRLPEPSRAADRLARERLREALLSGLTIGETAPEGAETRSTELEGEPVELALVRPTAQ